MFELEIGSNTVSLPDINPSSLLLVIKSSTALFKPASPLNLAILNCDCATLSALELSTFEIAIFSFMIVEDTL